MSQTIAVYTEGAIEHTRPVTLIETTGKDITAVPVKLTLGSYTESGGGWRDPDVDTSPAPASRVVALLVGDTYKPVAGTYWLWSWVLDGTERIPRRHEQVIIT